MSDEQATIPDYGENPTFGRRRHQCIDAAVGDAVLQACCPSIAVVLVGPPARQAISNLAFCAAGGREGLLLEELGSWRALTTQNKGWHGSAAFADVRYSFAATS